jgi:magnesium transporter
MLKELLKPEIMQLIDERKWTDLKNGLMDWPTPEIADLLLNIEKQDRVLLFRALPRDISADVFAYLEYDQRDSLLKELTDQETKNLLADMSPDDRTALLEELPDKATRRLINLLSPEDLKEARELLGYPEDSIGRILTPDFVAIRANWTVKEALDHIRKFGRDSETLYRLYVTEDGKLIDDIMLRYLILSDEKTPITNLMDYNCISVSAYDDQEEAVRIMERYDISTLPVVDSDGKLVGIVTFDDIMDVSSEEITEDFQRISGINPVDQSYLHAGVMKLWSKRIPWLLALMFTNFITVAFITAYDDVLKIEIALSFFIPLLIGTAGNTATQSATLVIRSLAVEEFHSGTWLKILSKEMFIGLLLGAFLGGITYIRGMMGEHGSLQLAIVISLTMLVLVVWANLLGTVLPLILSKFKLDPAVISSPLVATLIDVTGIIIYFNIAIWMLGL